MGNSPIDFFIDLPAILQYGFIAVLGLAFGSFSTVLIYRIPKGQTWWKSGQRSKCVSCRMEIPPVHLLPVISWLLLRGRCFLCGKKISLTYPLVESGVMLSCLLVFYILGANIHAFLIMICIPFLVAAFVIDLKHMILPNQITLIVIILALLDIFVESVKLYGAGTPFYEITIHTLTGQRILAAFVYLIFALAIAWGMKVALRREALGMGDIKFFFAAGLWLGLLNLAAFSMLSGILGVVFALFYAFLQKKQQRVFPFGPSLIGSLYILLLFDGSNFF